MRASCKWRNAQCATDNLSVILWGLLKRNVRGGLFDSEGGGGGCQIGLDRYFIFGMGSARKFIFMWHGLGKIYFHVNMVNHSPLRQLLETVMLLKAVV